MRHLFRVAVLTVAAAGLAACASTQSDLAGAPAASQSVAPTASAERRFGARESYMNRVENVARQRGLEVHWVNPPADILLAVE